MMDHDELLRRSLDASFSGNFTKAFDQVPPRATPGPWQVSPLDGRTCGPSRLLVCNGTTLAQMQAVAIVTLRTGETVANANLIAAAPSMLNALDEACDFLQDRMDVLDGSDGPRPDACMSLYQHLDEVRATARGERWPR